MCVPLSLKHRCHTAWKTQTQHTRQKFRERERVRKRDMQIGQRIVEIVALFPACRCGVFVAPIIEPVSQTTTKNLQDMNIQCIQHKHTLKSHACNSIHLKTVLGRSSAATATTAAMMRMLLHRIVQCVCKTPALNEHNEVVRLGLFFAVACMHSSACPHKRTNAQMHVTHSVNFNKKLDSYGAHLYAEQLASWQC